MVKTRMGLLDLRVQTAKLNATLRGSRVTNVYDDNGRTYILKLSVPPVRVQHDDPSNSTASVNAGTHSSWEKRLLLIESGVRVHMTHYDREKDIPSGFCIKLRKHIRTRRLEYVRQLGDGGDRIIDIAFSGEGAICAHLIIEAFSGGNVILTNPDYTILTLLRTYRLTGSESTAAKVAVKERYPVENARPLAHLERDSFLASVEKARASVPDAETVAKASGRAARRKLYARGIARKALAIELALEPTLLEHSLITAGFEAEATLDEICQGDHAGLHSVFDALTSIETQLAGDMAHGEMKGYVISAATDSTTDKVQQYSEFAPFLFAQYRNRQWKEFPSFDEAADEFFARLESERVEVSHAKREAATFKKVDKLENELKGQVTAFESARDKSWEMAQVIEGNIVEVEAAITVIRSAIAAAVPWEGLAQMVKDEKRDGNPIAEIIHSLQLENNQMTLMLEDTFGFDDDNEEEQESDGENDEDEDDGDDDEDDDDDGPENGQSSSAVKEINEKGGERSKHIFQSSPETRKALLVTVDIDLTAHANARRHYDMRKSAAAKMEKATEVKDRTIKAASKKAVSEAQKLEKEAVSASIRARRKAFWFEKFYWFVSSENYLVVAGRDAQQNELLVKRYLGPADVYVHADLEGASSVIVKNQKRVGVKKHSDIPRMTLDQAGTFAMCRSAAWESKIVTSAWWVRATQVSKTTSTGQYLSPGSFAIHGKKYFLNPTQLVMGLAFVFKVDENSAKKHIGERTVRGLEDADDTGSTTGNVDKPVDLKKLSESGEGSMESDAATVSKTEHGPAEGVEKDVAVVNMSMDLETTNSDLVPTVEQLSIDNGAPVLGNESVIEASGVGKVAPTEEADSERQSGKKRMSMKERKAPGGPRGGGASEPSSGTASQNAEDGMNVKGKAGGKGKAGAPLPRGKKHKLKRMKKYMDQGEVERKIALSLRGSKPMKEEGEGSQMDGSEMDNAAGKEDGAAGSERSGATGESGRKPRVHERRQEEMLLLDEEGIVELAKLEGETTAALQVLTAIPTEDDVVQFALPVCAPYHALSQYRYRVKLMPGSMKRGQAYRSGVVMFQKQAEKDLTKFKQERDAMRLTPESDGIHGMLGKVKITSPGLAEAQKALMKAKKGSAGASSKKGRQK